jgi:hypothetical protein
MSNVKAQIANPSSVAGLLQRTGKSQSQIPRINFRQSCRIGYVISVIRNFKLKYIHPSSRIVGTVENKFGICHLKCGIFTLGDWSITRIVYGTDFKSASTSFKVGIPSRPPGRVHFSAAKADANRITDLIFHSFISP